MKYINIEVESLKVGGHSRRASFVGRKRGKIRRALAAKRTSVLCSSFRQNSGLIRQEILHSGWLDQGQRDKGSEKEEEGGKRGGEGERKGRAERGWRREVREGECL